MALSGTGNTALVGAYNRTVNGISSAGTAYAFTRPPGGGTWLQVQEITASDAAVDDNFGSAIALSSDGNTGVIGALDKTVAGNSGAGAAYIETFAGGATAARVAELAVRRLGATVLLRWRLSARRGIWASISWPDRAA